MRPEAGPDDAVGRVGLVLVSHSGLVARGAAEMAADVAADVRVTGVGGAAQGGLGTDFDGVVAALRATDSGAGAVVLADLGSAIMTAELAIEQLDDARRGRVVLAEAPLVEGAVAAAVSAQTGAPLEAVRRAAEGARRGAGREASAAPAPTGYARTVTLVNEDGLHARPAAEFVKLAATFPARVTANGRDARSLLAILSLGLSQGGVVDIATETAEGRDAVDALAGLVERGFAKGVA